MSESLRPILAWNDSELILVTTVEVNADCSFSANVDQKATSYHYFSRSLISECDNSY
jgi:hypothetical protein